MEKKTQSAFYRRGTKEFDEAMRTLIFEVPTTCPKCGAGSDRIRTDSTVTGGAVCTVSCLQCGHKAMASGDSHEEARRFAVGAFRKE